MIVIFFWGCGTTSIMLDDKYVNADIFINGEMKGTNCAHVRRTGIPKKIKIEARSHNKTVGQISVRRKFTINTFIIGYFTYIGFFTAWQFPDKILVPVTDQSSVNHKSAWDESPGTNWK